ncbi:hypothetical protein NP493_2864g00000 [Ridgeia piscesae]|uniref:Kringle domain-containing protein n=1 Tax=Ridgeia piscesae TaxID=27915 RepID=A0AAD9JBU0_RIDPI|nr:hypothetical protein NP493_2864g00000 [Ridgeia piscesae]
MFPFFDVGHPCRFDSSSTSRGSCIFPCRCTKGCDQDTGQCLDGGQCKDDHPSGYKWSEPACQIGNVAFHKTASQSTAKWNERYPASKAVDGSIDRSYQHCAVPNGVGDTNAWWKVDLGENYKMSRVIIYNGNKGSDCYYDDEKGNHYMGRTSRVGSRTCRAWSSDWSRPDSSFPDGSKSAAGHYCRNPHEAGEGDRPWCYYNSNHNWLYCRVNRCQCDDGHLGVFCDTTCHCSSGSCDKTTGHCPSGCAAGWSGDNCQTGAQQSSAFTLSVGNSYDVNDHTQCASHNGAVAAGATVNESCTATGRYLSIRINGEADNHLATLCEVVVIGHKYICTYPLFPKPKFRSSVTPAINDVTSSNATVSWPRAADIPTDLEDYYHYMLWLQADGEREKNVTRVEQGAGEQRMEARITGLTFNVKYSLRLEPYRELNGEREGGASTGTITESGCDDMTTVRVEYKVDTSDSWNSVQPNKVTTTYVAIDGLSNGRYEVRLVVINNENLNSTSASKYVDFRMSE